jgi:hypothetical protein
MESGETSKTDNFKRCQIDNEHVAVLIRFFISHYKSVIAAALYEKEKTFDFQSLMRKAMMSKGPLSFPGIKSLDDALCHNYLVAHGVQMMLISDESTCSTTINALKVLQNALA